MLVRAACVRKDTSRCCSWKPLYFFLLRKEKGHVSSGNRYWSWGHKLPKPRYLEGTNKTWDHLTIEVSKKRQKMIYFVFVVFRDYCVVKENQTKQKQWKSLQTNHINKTNKTKNKQTKAEKNKTRHKFFMPNWKGPKMVITVTRFLQGCCCFLDISKDYIFQRNIVLITCKYFLMLLTSIQNFEVFTF